MASSIAFRSLTVEAFRGFAKEQSFDLDASVIILAGPNGTGKTSFFDAIQWLLLGSLERLWQFRTRQNSEHIVNVYRSSDRAKVSAEMSLNGQVVQASRTGSYSGTSLELRIGQRTVSGDDAEYELRKMLGGESIPLAPFMMSAAILQQDVMRRVLEAKSSDRFELLNQLLGLHELDGVESAAEHSTEAIATALKQARSQLESTELKLVRERSRLASAHQRVLGASDVSEARRRVEALFQSHASAFAPPFPQLSGLGEITRAEELVGRILRTVQTSSDELAVVGRELEGRSESGESSLDEARQLLAIAEASFNSARASMLAARDSEEKSVQSAQRFELLAVAAIPLLAPQCPVCGLDIDEAEVRRKLEDRSRQSSDVVALIRGREAAESAHSLAQAALEAARAEVDRLERATSQRRELTARFERLQREINAIDVSGSGLRPLRADGRTDLGETLAAASRLADLLRQLYVAASSADGGREAIAIRSQLDDTEGEAAVARERVSELVRRKAEADATLSATREALVSVSNARFRLLQPLIDDIFSRLDPHPTFKSFTFRHEIYRSRGTSVPLVLDQAVDVEADPLLVFSSSQANITALSYFLAVGWAAGPEAVPFLLLDDPLQSMDDVNVLGFADLCRHVRATRQLVISTHVPRFANLLERKLAPRGDNHRTVVLAFSGWD